MNSFLARDLGLISPYSKVPNKLSYMLLFYTQDYTHWSGHLRKLGSTGYAQRAMHNGLRTTGYAHNELRAQRAARTNGYAHRLGETGYAQWNTHNCPKQIKF